jgi:hypothetical protein
MLRALWRPLGFATRLGLALTSVGVAADFVHHVFTHDMQAAGVLNVGGVGHVLTLAGMVLAVGGVIHAAGESRRRARQKGECNAARSSTAAAR